MSKLLVVEVKFITEETVNVKKLPKFSDSRGEIFVAENKFLPFTVKRTFITFHKSGVRGNHAHKITEQLIICLKGSFRLKLINKNFEQNYKLDDPSMALYIPPLTWTELYEIEEESIILVFASEPYEKDDYIGSLESFMELISEEVSE